MGKKDIKSNFCKAFWFFFWIKWRARGGASHRENVVVAELRLVLQRRWGRGRPCRTQGAQSASTLTKHRFLLSLDFYISASTVVPFLFNPLVLRLWKHSLFSTHFTFVFFNSNTHQIIVPFYQSNVILGLQISAGSLENWCWSKPANLHIAAGH